MMTDNQSKRLIKAFERCESDRATWESHWQQVADLVLPSRQFTGTRTPGERRNLQIYDATAGKMVTRLAAGLHGFLTNPSTKWFDIQDEEPSFNEIQPYREWLDDVVLRMLRFLGSARSNFNVAAHEIYQDVVAFGTGAMSVAEKPGSLRFSARPLNEIFLKADDEDRVYQVYRKVELSAEDAMAKFSRDGDKLPKDVIDAANGNDPSKQSCYVHAVYLRERRDLDRLDAANKPVASVWIHKPSGEIVRESGFDRWPYLTPRWSKAAGEIYGRSPCMDILPDIGMVNALRKLNIEGLEKVVNPPLQVPATGTEGPIKTRPGAINYRRAGTEKIEPLNTGARPDLGEDVLDKERAGIAEGLHLDMLVLPQFDRATTAEVMAVLQQRMVFMSPILSRLQSEFMEPLITTTYRRMAADGELPPPPEGFAGRRLKIEYVSVMAQSQRASEATAIAQWLTDIAPIANSDPSILMNADIDKLAQHLASVRSVPRRIMRPLQDVMRMRSEMQQQALRAQQLAEVNQMADAAAKGGQAIGQVNASAA